MQNKFTINNINCNIKVQKSESKKYRLRILIVVKIEVEMQRKILMKKKQDSEYRIHGFLFETEREADIAKKEIEGIQYVKSKVDLKDPDMVLQLYCKVIDQGLFQTPVGISFLKEMQEYLEAEPFIRTKDIPPIPIKQEVVIEETVIERKRSRKNSVNKIYEINYKERFVYSAVINVLLLVAVICMFWIVSTSGNVNILNYENRLIDKYEKWEQELEQREQLIQEKEMELEEK